MEFLKTLCVTAALLSFAVLLLPEKKNIRSAALSLFSLVFLLVLLSGDPDFSFSALLPSEETEAIPPTEDYTETLCEAVREGIRADVAERFSLRREDITVKSDLIPTEEGFAGSFLSVSLGGRGFFADVPRLLTYLRKTYHENCEVYVYASQASS